MLTFDFAVGLLSRSNCHWQDLPILSGAIASCLKHVLVHTYANGVQRITGDALSFCLCRNAQAFVVAFLHTEQKDIIQCRSFSVGSELNFSAVIAD